MSKAQSVYICIFTDKAPNSSGSYAPELLGSPEAGMYQAVSAAASDLFQNEDIEGTLLSICYMGAPDFQDYLKTVNVSPPFIAILGTFPDGTKKQFLLKSTTGVKNYIRAMWTGEFGGTGIPTNPGDGDGGWGTGDSFICKLIPPLCALGFLPWLALAAVATYKTAESRSPLGKATWGIPAGLLWLGFFERGGVKQIQWWMKNAGIQPTDKITRIND